ncbi:unnamed protein product, partial [Sphacelaria rigidula]
GGTTGTATAPAGNGTGVTSGTGGGTTGTATAPAGNGTGVTAGTGGGTTGTATAPGGGGTGATSVTGGGTTGTATAPAGNGTGVTTGTGGGATGTATAPAGNGTGATTGTGGGATGTATAPAGNSTGATTGTGGGTTGTTTGGVTTGTTTVADGGTTGAATVAGGGATGVATGAGGGATGVATGAGGGATGVATGAGGGATGVATGAGGGATGAATVTGGGATGSTIVAGGGATGAATGAGGGATGATIVAGGGATGATIVVGGGATGATTIVGGGATGATTVVGGGATGATTVAGGGTTGATAVAGGGATTGTTGATVAPTATGPTTAAPTSTVPGSGPTSGTTTATGTSSTTTGTTGQATTSNAQVNNSTTSGAGDQVSGQDVVDPGSTSQRSASATLGLLMVFQMQFLSTLRLLEANISEPFMDMMKKLMWLNLHFDDNRFTAWLACGDKESVYSWQENSNGIWLFNTLAVFAGLLFLVVMHVLFLSFTEARWLATSNAFRRSRLQRRRERGKVSASLSPRTAYTPWLDENEEERELDRQEAMATERFFKRHTSMLLYFPHVELVFLLLTYQGASAAEARMLTSGCWPLVVIGGFAMFIFPIMMIVWVSRIVLSRIRPQYGPVDYEHRWANESERPKVRVVNFFKGVGHGWRTGDSVFSWADQGAWKCRTREDEDLDGRKFRIGFEPLFVDFTKRGAVYIVFMMFKWFVLGIVSGEIIDIMSR